MITKNFKLFLALSLEGGGTSGLIPVKKLNGGEALLAPYFPSDTFPSSYNNTVRITSYSNDPGIYIGSGDTPPTENDYDLSSRITSGLSASSVTQSVGLDASGNPYKQLLFTLTNNTAADIVVKEIGYVQIMRAGLVNSPTVITNEKFLIDRTVLSSPVTVPANGNAAIKYTLKTIIS